MIFDSVSWGEIFILTGATALLVGKKDLPVACNFLGTQIGRAVGLLQGARIRADRFAQHHELKALQNELRSGLRELDVVKSEMAMATTNVAGRSLGSTVQSANRKITPTFVPPTPEQSNYKNILQNEGPMIKSKTETNSDQMNHVSSIMEHSQYEKDPAPLPVRKLAPRSHSVRAVAEEEWERRGIGFKSVAEQGGNNGSSLLSSIIQHSLIHDQYDRAVQEEKEKLNKKTTNS